VFTAAFDRWFKGNGLAMRFCADMVEVAHVWDDLGDCDKPVAAATADATFRKMMLEMPAGEFYRENFTFLHPVMILVWAQWDAANRMEAAYPIKNDFVKGLHAPRLALPTVPCLRCAVRRAGLGGGSGA
jgi:hypothetical protein